MTKVLVLESDSEFAAILSSGLSEYGCEVSIVSDGEEGIALATAQRPELILLTIELPRMNGFSVCNRLKRNEELKDIPLILLSSEATDETFEQHQRLRTRADVYVKKPVTVEELVEKLQGIFTLQRPGEEVDLIEVDDEMAIEELPEEPETEESIEEETEEAFGHLMSRPVAPPSAADVEMDDLEFEDDDSPEVASAEEAPPPEGVEVEPIEVEPDFEPFAAVPAADSSQWEDKVASLEARLGQMESELELARTSAAAQEQAKEQLSQKKAAEIELLQREVEELRGKLSSKEGGTTAREFLDLREQLNKKDKEILEVRDILHAKEKDLIRLNDENIGFGREKADLTDQLSALKNSKGELERKVSALERDKSQAQKRGDDFKAKSERLQADLESKSKELTATVESHQSQIATRDARDAALREEQQSALAQAAESAALAQRQAVEEALRQAAEEAATDKEAALVQAAQEAQQAQASALAARESEMKAEQDSRLAALHRANEEATRSLRAEHEQALREAAEQAAARLAQRETELVAEKEAALNSQKAESDAAYARVSEQMDAAEKQWGSRIAQLEESLALTIAESSNLKSQLENEAGKLSQARQKWESDSAALNKVSESLQGALAEIEQAKARSMP